MCGASEAYTMFVFPQQIPLQVYIQVSWASPKLRSTFWCWLLRLFRKWWIFWIKQSELNWTNMLRLCFNDICLATYFLFTRKNWLAKPSTISLIWQDVGGFLKLKSFANCATRWLHVTLNRSKFLRHIRKPIPCTPNLVKATSNSTPHSLAIVWTSCFPRKHWHSTTLFPHDIHLELVTSFCNLTYLFNFVT